MNSLTILEEKTAINEIDEKLIKNISFLGKEDKIYILGVMNTLNAKDLVKEYISQINLKATGT